MKPQIYIIPINIFKCLGIDSILIFNTLLNHNQKIPLMFNDIRHLIMLALLCSIMLKDYVFHFQIIKCYILINVSQKNESVTYAYYNNILLVDMNE